MDLKDIIAKDRKDGAIEFANWITLNDYYTHSSNSTWFNDTGCLIADNTEELYELFLKEKG